MEHGNRSHRSRGSHGRGRSNGSGGKKCGSEPQSTRAGGQDDGSSHKLPQIIFSMVLAVLSFQMGPDRPNFKSYCVLDPKLAVGTRPEPFRATFRPPKKSATGKNTNFALEGYNRFMKPSWVRAHGLIFGKVYIVWVCAPPYSPLSSPRSRIRENRA